MYFFGFGVVRVVFGFGDFSVESSRVVVVRVVFGFVFACFLFYHHGW